MINDMQIVYSSSTWLSLGEIYRYNFDMIHCYNNKESIWARLSAIERKKKQVTSEDYDFLRESDHSTWNMLQADEHTIL